MKKDVVFWLNGMKPHAWICTDLYNFKTEDMPTIAEASYNSERVRPQGSWQLHLPGQYSLTCRQHVDLYLDLDLHQLCQAAQALAGFADFCTFKCGTKSLMQKFWNPQHPHPPAEGPSKMWWHIDWTPKSSLPKQLLYGEICQGMHTVGRQKKWFQDCHSQILWHRYCRLGGTCPQLPNLGQQDHQRSPCNRSKTEQGKSEPYTRPEHQPQ